jgi:uncharacterized protein
MSAQTVIDSLEFARTEQILRGSLPIPGLTRLQDSLYDAVGLVDFVVQGGHDARRRPTLSLEVSGVLHLRCQRCLGQLDFPLRLVGTLLLGSPGDAAPDGPADEESEWIEASAQLDVASLVEEEIILGLPYSPRHPEGQCRARHDAQAGDTQQSAFEKLAALKRDLN